MFSVAVVCVGLGVSEGQRGASEEEDKKKLKREMACLKGRKATAKTRGKRQ